MSLPSFHIIDAAPQPVATFSHAAEVDGWVFLTGQMPTWPGEPDKPLPIGVEAQTKRVMGNLILVLEGMQLSIVNVVQARAYLTHFERDYAAINEAYQSYYAEGKLPARTCIGVTGLQWVRLWKLISLLDDLEAVIRFEHAATSQVI